MLSRGVSRYLISAGNSIYFQKGLCYTTIRNNQAVVDPPDDKEIGLPEYRQRVNEPLHVRRARLVYQSRKRGMLENDLLLSTFAAKYLNTFTEQQLEQYDKLINKPSNDWDILNWANGKKPTPPEYDTEVMELLKEHLRNVHKESRLRQPDL